MTTFFVCQRVFPLKKGFAPLQPFLNVPHGSVWLAKHTKVSPITFVSIRAKLRTFVRHENGSLKMPKTLFLEVCHFWVFPPCALKRYCSIVKKVPRLFIILMIDAALGKSMAIMTSIERRRHIKRTLGSDNEGGEKPADTSCLHTTKVLTE